MKLKHKCNLSDSLANGTTTKASLQLKSSCKLRQACNCPGQKELRVACLKSKYMYEFKFFQILI